MATIYVSQTATNGYAVGNDANTYAQAQNKATPKLTIAGAVAVALSGDTIKVNDGTYTSATFFNFNLTNPGTLTVEPENDYMVTLKGASTSRVVYVNNQLTTFTIGKFVIDAEYNADYALQQCNSGNTTLILDGTHLINFKISGLYGIGATNVTLSGDWLIESTLSTVITLKGIDLTFIAAGTASISGGSVTIEGGASSSSVYGIYLTASIAGCKLKCYENEFSLGSGNATATIQEVHPVGFAEYEIHDNDAIRTTLQTGGSFQGIQIPNSAITTKKCWVYRNNIDGGNPNPATNGSGICICIGDDADSSAYPNSINGIWVWGNTTENMNHQILFGWVTGAEAYGNLCENGVIGIVTKHSIGCTTTGNILKDIQAGGALRAKGDNGSKFFNNTVIMTGKSTATGVAMLATDASTGSIFKNNIVYMQGVAAKCVDVEDTSTATFSHNDYYTNSGFAENPFAYQGTGYADLAAWKAAHEATALNVDPTFVDYDNGDYRVPATNADLYHKGTYAGANARDYRSRPFNVKPTIGAYEVTAGDKCKTRTARAA